MRRKYCTPSNAVKRVLLLLLAINLMGISVSYYYNTGTYKYVGSFSGWPIYWYFPTSATPIISLFMFLSGALIFVWSLKPTHNNVKASVLLAIFSLMGTILAIRILYLGEETHKVLLALPSRTDAYFLQIKAAESIIHGLNPYVQDYRDAFVKGLEPMKYTWIYNNQTPPYTVDKIVDFVHKFDYLPPAALWYIPAVILGISGNVWDALMISIALTLVYLRIRREFKAIFPAIIASSMFIYIGLCVAQVPIAGWLVPLMLAAVFPDKPVLAGISLIWASSYRLYAGLFALFYLIAAYYEGYDVKKMISSAFIAGILLNMPFFILNPQEFIKNVTIPLTSNFRPLDVGPGLASLQFLGFSIPKMVHMPLVSGITITGLIMANKFYSKLKYIIFLFPTLAMFCYYRPSFAYYLYYPFLALLAYVTGFFKFREEDYVSHPELLRNISAYSVVLAMMSIFITFKFVSLFVFGRILLAFVLLATPLLLNSLKKSGQVKPLTLFLVLIVSLGISALFVEKHLHSLIFTVTGYNYKTDATIIPILASKDIVNGNNPYFIDHLNDMLNRKDFGILYELVYYNSTPIVIDSFTQYRSFTPYVDPRGQILLYGYPISYIGFYDYPPGLALSLVPAELFGIPASYWSTLLYLLALIILIVRVWKRNGDEGLLAMVVVFFAGYFITVYRFAFYSNSTPYIALVLLSLAFSDNPAIFGLFLGLASATMPQATLLLPYIFIMIYSEFGYEYAKKAATLTILAFLGIFLPFLYPTPLETVKRAYFPLFATLPVDGISIIALFEKYCLRAYWPSTSLKSIPFIIVIATLALYSLYYDKLRDSGLTLPIFVIMFFYRAYIHHVAYYPLIAFAAWLTIISGRESVRHGILGYFGCLRKHTQL